MSDPIELKNMAVKHYRELFSSDSQAGGEFIRGGFPQVDSNLRAGLVKQVNMEETANALKGKGSFKVPGPDGYQAVFFKRAWSVVGEVVHHFVWKIIEEGDIPEDAAEAILVLIPKKDKPNSMRDFRPLSICNVTYKLASKIIVNRLRDLVKDLVSPCQSSFVPGRQSLDDVVICREVVHTMKRTKSRRGMVVMKVDLEKSCDRLEWQFIGKILEDDGVPGELSNIILKLISNGSCRLAWNGDATDCIRPSRGLR